MGRGKSASSKIIDGYIHFKIGEQSQVHYLHQSTNSFDISDIETAVEMGREEEGMKKFILTNYAFYEDNGGAVSEDKIEVVSHHFEFERND
jgi:hypothetical protein